MKRILIIAGGTGGHIFPALAVANRLKQQGYQIFWLGARYGLEAKLVPDHYPIEYVSVEGMRGRGLKAKILAPWRLISAVIKSYRIIQRLHPDVVLAMGGYVSVPGGLAAKISGCPLVIHEQNAKAGLSNRVLAKIAKIRLQAFEKSFVSKMMIQTVGNPVRDALLSLPSPDERYSNHVGPLRVLILGGSQGARAINHCVMDAWRTYTDREQVVVWHQTGEADYKMTSEAYQALSMKATVEAFIHDMAKAYAWADLVICRAGAMTVSELAAVGLPSILIPFPHAVDNHQYYNAKYLSDAQAGFLIEQKELSVNAILNLIERFVANRQGLLIMAQSAKRLARPDAADQVAQQCINCMQL